jgi:ribosomal protein S18 acetylase RimI-like enzyme
MITLKTKYKTHCELANINTINFLRLSRTLSDVSPHYPNFKEWLYFTFRKEMIQGLRTIAVARHQGVYAGFSLLKNASNEKKICTFYVLPSFRGMSIGSQLMDFSTTYLGNTDISITVSEERNPELYPLLRRKGFSLESRVKGYYRDNADEYFYSLK